MGDPLDIIKDVALNFATGGLYSVGKATKKTIETGNPMFLLSQGLDVGVAAVGNELAVAIGGPSAGMAFNLAGLGLGLAGASGAFSSLPGFAPGGVAPVATSVAPGTAIPLAPGVTPTGAEIAGASLTGPVAAPGATPVIAATNAPTGLLAAPVVSGTSTVTPAIVKQAITQIPLGAESNPALMKAWFAGQTPEVQAALLQAGGGASGGGSELLKYGGLMLGGQMLTGALGGIFEGVSAEKKLALENLINSQREAQVQYANRNNQYAPLLQFKNPRGTLSTPRVV